MMTTLSSKGQIVIPWLARAKLDLQPGAKLICEMQGDSIVLKPEATRRRKTALVIDKVTGLRVTKATTPKSVVTSDLVKALSADIP